MGRNRKDIPSGPAGQHDDDSLLWEKVTQSVSRMNQQPSFQTTKQGGGTKTGPTKTSWTERPRSVQTGQPKAKTLPDKR